MSASQAEQEFTQQKLVLESMYQTRPQPYPGFFSQKKTCPEKFKPKMMVKEDSRYWLKFFILKATSRRSFGVCSDAEAGLMAAYFFMYCRDQSHLFTGRIFYPLNVTEDALRAEVENLKCDELFKRKP